METYCKTTLWDQNLTWFTTNPFFTSCFEESVLVPLPVVFLALFGILDIIAVVRSKEIQKISFRSITILTTLKIFGNVSLICVSATQLIKEALEFDAKLNGIVHVVSPALQLAGYVGNSILFFLTYRSDINNSGVQFIFWFISLVCHGILFRTALAQLYVSKHGILMASRLISFPIILLRFLLEWFNPNSCRRKSEQDKNKTDNPDNTSPFLSKILLCWYDHFAWNGYRKTLHDEDIWDLNQTDKCNFQYLVFNKNWTCGKNGQLGSIWVPILRSHGLQYTSAFVLKVVGGSLMLVQPIIVRHLIAHVRVKEEPSWKGYFYMAVVCVTVCLEPVLMVNSDKMVALICLRVKSALSNAVFRKSLRVSNAAKAQDSNAGAMMNLMSVDVQNFMNFNFVHNAVHAPLLVGISMYMLYEEFGLSAFAGLGVMAGLMIGSNLLTASLGTKYQRLQMKFRDERIKVTSEVLSGIKVLKFYAWEVPFQQKIQRIRKRELNCIWKFSTIFSFVTTFCIIAPVLVAMTTFSCYILSNPAHVLTAEKVFVLICIMHILKGLMVIIPTSVINMSQIYVSAKRLNQFFQLEDLDSIQQNQHNGDGDILAIENGTFGWTSSSNTLSKLNLKVEKGELIAVVGRIGSGKSSLLTAVLGEMKKKEGSFCIPTSVSYVAQVPWIQNATVQENILFGDAYDEEKYRRVLDACALETDLKSLPGGDLTEIGEKGINLSGGQKQRLALARAAYKNASLYLFDDPLSAVDANVGHHIFQSLIGPEGMLKLKTRVLVTHNMAILPNVDRILVINDGKITDTGTYKELLKRKSEISELLESLQENASDGQNSEGTQSKPRILPFANPQAPASFETVKLVKEEKSAEGSIKFRYYFNYFTSAGVPVFILAFLFFLLSEGFAGYANVYLSHWTSQEVHSTSLGIRNSNTTHSELVEYVILGGAQGTATLLAFMTLTVLCLIATKKLHDSALGRILRCPVSYFDTTLTGALLSRFSRDVEVTDFPILNILRMVFHLFLGVLVTIVVISMTTPNFVFALIPIGAVYFLLQRFYVATSRQLKRMESVTRSPIYAYFTEVLSGASTIRAFKQEELFIAESERRIDQNQKCQYAFVISNLWVSLRLELIGAAIVFFTCLFVLRGRESLEGGSAGLAVTYALSITIYLNILARQLSELENNIVAVERLSELIEAPQEAPWEISGTKPAPSWPSVGEIVFQNYSTRYREGLDSVLGDIQLKIHGGEKVGVVGRTGAGKSSLAMSLFRIMEPTSGRILIDGLDTSKLGVHDLRNKLTIIPQEPLLFSGSIRENLDPFGDHADETLWSCLSLTHLENRLNDSHQGLNFKVEEDGKNFSVGERQLICLARALLRKSRILVLDEATAAVDGETDDFIQGIIRKEFSGSTVITIAHRLNTVIDSDKILVLDHGKIQEFDSPTTLLSNGSSKFFKMIQKTKMMA